MKEKLYAFAGILTFVLVVSNTHGEDPQVLLSEDWSSGAINSSVWTSGGNVSVGMVDGDNALIGSGANTFCYSSASWSRANSLTATWRIWHAATAGQEVAMRAPFHNASDITGQGNPGRNDCAPCFDGEHIIGAGSPSLFYWQELPQPNFNTGLGRPEAAFNTAFDNAVDRASSVVIRVEMGTSGSKIEWSTGGGAFAVLQNEGAADFDTIGQAASSSVSDISPVWFGVVLDKTTTYIDDIVVETLTPVEVSGFLVD